MKLIDFNNSQGLKSLLEAMGTELVTRATDVQWHGIDDPLLEELFRTGEADIGIEQLELDESGAFIYKGQKILVYIRDQYQNYYERGYKFHLTRCNSVLKSGRTRYVASKRIDGIFTINLIDDGIVVREGLTEPLTVCKNCLSTLNYKQYNNHSRDGKKEIYSGFDLEDYFETNRTDFQTNQFRDAETAAKNVYNPDFEKTSRLLRERKGYKCDECEISMSKHKKFCHVHHKDRDKSNDLPSNLQVLCITCHSEQPHHTWLRSNPDFWEFDRMKREGVFGQKLRHRKK